MFSSPTSRWTGGAAAVCLGLVAVTYVTLVGPKRGEAADLEQAAAGAEQQNDSLQLRTAQLRAQFATLPQKQAELGAMLGQVPVTADVPHFVRSLDGLASSSGVTLDTVTPSVAQILGPAGGLVGAGTTGGSGTSGPTAGAASSGASGTTGSGASGALPGAPPGTTGTGTDGGGGATAASAQVVAVPITLTVHGPYFKAVTFLKGLQSGQRAFLVTGLQVAVAGSDITLTVKGRIFAVPSAAQALAALAGQ